MKPRKLSLIRKGFDSSYGGCPSPIFPDGTIYSLPIPGDDHAAVHYGDLDHGNVNIGQVVEDLTRGRLDARDGVHLDPDVRQDAIRRHKGWRGIFGRTRAPEGHLEKQGVGTGDVFLLIAYLIDAGELDPEGDLEEQFLDWYRVRGETVSGERQSSMPPGPRRGPSRKDAGPAWPRARRSWDRLESSPGFHRFTDHVHRAEG